jgi:hypothetical protein
MTPGGGVGIVEEGEVAVPTGSAVASGWVAEGSGITFNIAVAGPLGVGVGRISHNNKSAEANRIIAKPIAAITTTGLIKRLTFVIKICNL